MPNETSVTRARVRSACASAALRRVGASALLPVVLVGPTLALATLDGGRAPSAAHPELRATAVEERVAPGGPGVQPAPILTAEAFAYDASVPHDLMIHDSERRDGIEVRDTSYVDAASERRGAYLVLPESAGPHPAVLFVHWYEPESPTSNRTQFRDEAVGLAKHGVVSLLVDTLWSEPTWFAKRDRARDLEHSIAEVRELRRALDVLLAQKDVDPARVAYVGHDFGAMFGALVVALEPRVDAFAFQAGTTSFSDWYLLGTRLAPAERHKVIDALAVLDPVRFVAASRPVPTLYQFGTTDPYVPKTKAEELFEATTGPKEILWYEAGHGLDEQAVRDRVEWMKKTLKL